MSCAFVSCSASTSHSENSVCQAVPWSTTECILRILCKSAPQADSLAFFHLTWIKISQKLVFREISFRSWPGPSEIWRQLLGKGDPGEKLSERNWPQLCKHQTTPSAFYKMRLDKDELQKAFHSKDPFLKHTGHLVRSQFIWKCPRYFHCSHIYRSS